MAFIDVNELKSNSDITGDICIVGSGAAGITIARELDGSSQTVCLIDSGSHGPDEETQSLYDIDVVGYPVRENFMSRARYFGGTCNLWAGKSMKLTALDLNLREWIPHSGWPITYAELSQYYPKAENILRLPHFRNSRQSPSATAWARRRERFSTMMI
jgi:choline dehydrogenase-like flavoprotein